MPSRMEKKQKKKMVWLIGGVALVLAGVALWYFVFRRKAPIAKLKTATSGGTGSGTTLTGSPLAGLLGNTYTAYSGGGGGAGQVDPPPPPDAVELIAAAGPQFTYTGSIDTGSSYQNNPDQLHVVATGYANGRVSLNDDASAGGENAHYLTNSGYWLDSINGLSVSPKMPLTLQLFRSNSPNPADWQHSSNFRGYSFISFTVSTQ